MENKVFEDIVHLLQGADWLYNYPMTQVFTRNIFTHMPVEWQKALTDLPLDVLNGLPQCLTQDQWPSSLKVFLQECQRLSCLSPDLGPQTSGGSRRGSSSSNVSGSSSSSSSSSNLQIPQELTYGLTIIIKVFRDCVQASSLVLLSCCYHKMSLRPKAADDPASDKQESQCKGSDDTEGHGECPVEGDPPQNEEMIPGESDFMNFPMSQSLQEIFRQNNFHMSVFGLRLGAQKSGQNWCTETLEDHEYHTRNVAYRGILEAACVEEGLTLRKLRRRCVRKSGFEDFSEYKRNIFDNYEFQKTGSDGTPMESVPNSESTLNMNEDKILERNTHISATLDTCFENHKHYFPLIEPLTGLQLALQPVIEILVQMDRLIYLKECGFSRVWLEKVFDAEVSPRNIALLAVR